MLFRSLGLIKFDEPEEDLHSVISDARLLTTCMSGSQAMFIDYLKAHGYKIERI